MRTFFLFLSSFYVNFFTLPTFLVFLLTAPIMVFMGGFFSIMCDRLWGVCPHGPFLGLMNSFCLKFGFLRLSSFGLGRVSPSSYKLRNSNLVTWDLCYVEVQIGKDFNLLLKLILSVLITNTRQFRPSLILFLNWKFNSKVEFFYWETNYVTNKYQ